MTEKALCYVRVSTKYQEDQPRRNEQIRSMEAICKAKGLDYEIIPECFSAKTIEKRKIFSKVLERLKYGEAKYLFVYTVDRLSRNSEEAQRIGKDSIKQGWKLMIVTLPNLDISRDTDWFTFALLTTLAEQEVRVLGTRVREGTQRAKLEGKPVGGHRHGMYDPAIIKKIYYYKYKGLTMAEIADKMNELGIESSLRTHDSQKLWSVSKIRGIFQTYNSKAIYIGNKYRKKPPQPSSNPSN